MLQNKIKQNFKYISSVGDLTLFPCGLCLLKGPGTKEGLLPWVGVVQGISVSGVTASLTRQVYVLSESGFMTHSKLPIPLRLRSVELRGLHVLRRLNGKWLLGYTYIYRRKQVVTCLSLPMTLKNKVSYLQVAFTVSFPSCPPSLSPTGLSGAELKTPQVF